MITVDFLGLIEVIFNIVVKYYSLLNSIVSERNSVFISKF